ncbi:MAG: two-component system response regulator [Magnetococcales bacterium]|nr:two-component system response regulator [Magnetococcales bacterium]MBF0113746.1 two-component system response regulator [Magnetococcales bacterium]
MAPDHRPVILVVDDSKTNLDLLVHLLSEHYEISVALDGESALEIALSDQPDLILLDIMMPRMDGYETCCRLKMRAETRDIPVIFVTARRETSDEAQGFALGAVDYITKPISPPLVKARIKTHLQLKQAHDQARFQNQLLEEKVCQRTMELQETQLAIVRKLGRAAEFRDNETGLHIVRMSHYAQLLGLACGMGETEATLLLNASPLHDVGKIGIPDHILLKPGKLTDEEFRLIRNHPEIGAEIIGKEESPLLKMAFQIAYTHHEKWDGSGYPRALRGSAIPLVGRISAIADVFDAITSARPYKKAWPMEEALAWLQAQSGYHFDPHLVALFLAELPKVQRIKERFSETHP